MQLAGYSGSRNRAWTHSKMILFQITSNDKVSHFKIAYTCDTLHRSIQFQTWNLHKNAWNFIKLHRPTQFQTWNLHVNMMHCIARHNFKLRNDSFSYENWGPGIFLSLSLFKMYQKNVLVHALLRDPLRKPCLRFCLNLRVLNLQNLLKNGLK